MTEAWFILGLLLELLGKRMAPPFTDDTKMIGGKPRGRGDHIAGLLEESLNEGNREESRAERNGEEPGTFVNTFPVLLLLPSPLSPLLSLFLSLSPLKPALVGFLILTNIVNN